LPPGRYRIVGPVIPLTIDRGVTDTYQGQAAIFLKKSPPVPPPYYAAVEFICAELAKQIRLPVPPSFVAELPGEEDRPAFTCLAFNLSGGSTPPIDPAEAVAAEPDLCTGVLMFDIWIVNTDRHVRNVSFQALRRPHRLNIFDHGHALIFYPDSLTHFANRLGIIGPPNGRGNRHCFLDVLASAQYVMKWIERIGRVPDDIIREICQDAGDLGLPDQLSADTATFLISRRDRLAQLVADHRAEFRQIADWPLL
jgi:hypothetical protein